MSKQLRAWSVFIAIFFAFINATNAQPSKRVALLIGNTNYLYEPLMNPSNDVNGVGLALKELGFTVLERHNQTRKQIFTSLDVFADAAKGADIALVFYSGHGLQAALENYLIPVDENILAMSDDTLSTQALPLSSVLSVLENSQARVKVAIFDACRDSAAKGGALSHKNSFVETAPAYGTLVAYSTAPGKQAADVGQSAEGKPLPNSPYAHALIQALRTQHTLQEVFVNVQGEVAKLTQLRQTPWTVNGLTGLVVLRGVGEPTLSPQSITKPSAPTAARKTLFDMGLPWNQATFNETLLRNDSRASALYFQGGMKINDGQVLNQWLSGRHNAESLNAAITHKGIDDAAICANLKLNDSMIFYTFKQSTPEFKLLTQMKACKKIIGYQIRSQRDPQGVANDLLKSFQTAVGVKPTSVVDKKNTPTVNAELEKSIKNIVDLSQAMEKR